MSKMNWNKARWDKQTESLYRQADHRARHTYVPFVDIEVIPTKHKQKKNHKQALHTQAMKLASRLYHTMLSQPDFMNDNKKELWGLAVSEAKKKFGLK